MNVFNASKVLFAAAVAVGVTAGALASVQHVAVAAAKPTVTLERVTVIGHRIQPTMIVMERTLVIGHTSDIAKADSNTVRRAA